MTPASSSRELQYLVTSALIQDLVQYAPFATEQLPEITELSTAMTAKHNSTSSGQGHPESVQVDANPKFDMDLLCLHLEGSSIQLQHFYKVGD